MQPIRFSSLLTPEECECLLEKRYLQMCASVPDPERVVRLYEAFLAEKDEAARRRWSFAIDDPTDPDDGLVRKQGEAGGDHKWYFHWSPRLVSLLNERHVSLSAADEDFLYAAGKLYEAAARLALEASVSLNAFFRNRYPIREGLGKAYANPIAYSEWKLRIISYTNAEIEVKRARVHRDRSFLTLHLFEEGGHLFGCRDQYGHEKFIIPRKEGKIPVFFGLKADMLTKKHCRALWHGSESAQGECRSAVVFFAHTNERLQHATR